MKQTILKSKLVKVETGNIMIAVLNEIKAMDLGINAGDRIRISMGKKHVNAIVDLSSVDILPDEIGLFEEVSKELGIKKNNVKLKIKQVPNPKSVEYIKKKVNGKTLSYDEIYEIVNDVVHNKLSDIEMSAFVTATYTEGLTFEETISLTKAVVNTGNTLHLKNKLIVDKHCLGGVAGNRTTMVVVPIIAAFGLVMPKTSSRSITSPAGTADTMEVLAEVEFSAEKLEKIVEKVGACIAFGGTVNLAAADDKLIKVRHPLHLDPIGLMLASIMAKKKAVGSTHVLIDIPIGEEAKVKTFDEAELLGTLFESVGEELNMKVDYIITDGSSPIGRGIGPLLEARDVLMVLQQHENRPLDLEKKSLELAGIILEFSDKVSRGKGEKIAKEILQSGKAWLKMKEIIKAQKGNPNINIEDLTPKAYKYEIKAKASGVVKKISNRSIAKVALAAGAPAVIDAGVYLEKIKGDKVKKGETLMSIYYKSKEKLKKCLDILKENPPYVIE